MKHHGSPRRPTEAELAILRVLWERGASTVRDVHEALSGDVQVGYTTVLKLLQIMFEKDLVTRDESERAHVYGAARSKRQTQGQLVKDLLHRAFDDSASELMVTLLGDSKVSSAEELAQIRTLLDELEHGLKEEDR